VIACLLPTFVAAVAFVFVFGSFPPLQGAWTGLFDSEKLFSATFFVLAIWSIAVLLSVQNEQVTRMLQGRSGPFALKQWYEDTLAKRAIMRAKLTDLHNVAQAKGPDSDAWVAYIRERRRFLANFPAPSMCLPTRFGNVSRVSESYVLQVYGADSLSFWPRIRAVIEKEYQDYIDRAETPVALFVNGFVLAWLLALCRLAAIVPVSRYCFFDSAAGPGLPSHGDYFARQSLVAQLGYCATKGP
jgi:hypothetical protein